MLIVSPPGQAFPDPAGYSTQTLLAWCLNHYFYEAEHYVYVSEAWYPYRLPNPKSSNPLLIYQDLYQPAFDQDKFDKFTSSQRLGLENGVTAKLSGLGRTDARTPYIADLQRICRRINTAFLWPVIYLVNLSVAQGGTKAGSGASGSAEWLVPNLAESDFSLLIPDHDRLPVGGTTAEQALTDHYLMPNGTVDYGGLVNDLKAL